MIIGIVFVILFLALSIWLFVKYITLIICNKKVCVAFDLLFARILKKYELILNDLNNSENGEMAEETRNLINKALKFSVKTDGYDRIIRFANAIFANAEKLSILSEDKEFDFAKEQYNTFSKQLRHYIDVFPTSLLARLAEIKTKDCLK